jgi:hypothetical protein
VLYPASASGFLLTSLPKTPRITISTPPSRICSAEVTAAFNDRATRGLHQMQVHMPELPVLHCTHCARLIIDTLPECLNTGNHFKVIVPYHSLSSSSSLTLMFSLHILDD